MTAQRPSSRIFYGWFVVAAAFVITFVGFGSAYTFGSFVDAFEKTFGASRGEVSLVFSLAGFLYFSLGAVSGPLADRWGARWLAVIGMIFVGMGLIFAGRAETLVGVYLAYGLGIGIGIGFAYVPALGAVQRWFVQRRGLASGLAVSGIGVGTLAMPPLATALVANLGWRGAYSTLGVLAIVVGSVAALLINDDPACRGLHPDGISPETAGPSVTRAGLSVRQAVRTRRFAELYMACLIGSLGVFVPFVHLVPFAVDLGMSSTAAVWLMGAIGIGSTIGRFFLGGVADKMGRERFLVAMYLGMAGSLVIWALSATPLLLVIFALSFGLFYGGWVAVLPAVVADLFGSRSVGGIIGVLYTSVAIGTLIGPSSVGFIYDISHSYFVSIAASAVSNAVAAVIVVLAVKRSVAERKPG
ncbi:OFA family oxalate/formate antiporter-like MFS transporter [Mesorhizobium soli]|uniref:MFS transporter n=1 Tax=Pseudaminobacter soli (ex Li et al. 2025) TaxID=1295366 RepID=UPI002474889B|nr:MFS transporter [Mesorhizobium soli]MDH6234518.1 OFA family oxalate/formate antiporter-like MFS transporter [Mesorhizobium soli]